MGKLTPELLELVVDAAMPGQGAAAANVRRDAQPGRDLASRSRSRDGARPVDDGAPLLYP